jgi:hypothetical protein
MFCDWLHVCSLKNQGALLLLVAAGILFPAQLAKAASQTTLCTPDEVQVYTSNSVDPITRDQRSATSPPPRLHVHCTAAVGGIQYFALSTADAPQAARVLSVITSALLAGRTLTIRYDPADLSGSGIGCLNTDCRLIQSIGFGK